MLLCVLQGPAGAKGDKGERVSQTTQTHSLQEIISPPIFVEILVAFMNLLSSALQFLYLDEGSLIFGAHHSLIFFAKQISVFSPLT